MGIGGSSSFLMKIKLFNNRLRVLLSLNRKDAKDAKFIMMPFPNGFQLEKMERPLGITNRPTAIAKTRHRRCSMHLFANPKRAWLLNSLCVLGVFAVQIFRHKPLYNLMRLSTKLK